MQARALALASPPSSAPPWQQPSELSEGNDKDAIIMGNLVGTMWTATTSPFTRPSLTLLLRLHAHCTLQPVQAMKPKEGRIIITRQYILKEDFTRLHLAFPCPPSSTCTLRKGEVKKRVYGNYEEELWENLVGTLLRGPPLPSPPLRDQVHVHFQNPIHFLPVGTIGGEAKNYGKLIVFALSENQNHLQILESKESRFLDVWFTFLNLCNHTVV